MTEEETKKQNYERLMLALAVLFSRQLNVDIVKQDSYQKLTPAQKTYVQKVYEANPRLAKQVESGQRISEEQIVRDVSEVA